MKFKILSLILKIINILSNHVFQGISKIIFSVISETRNLLYRHGIYFIDINTQPTPDKSTCHYLGVN